MTLTSTGPSGFHLKPLVTILAAVVFVAAAYVVAQQLLTDDQPSASAPSAVVVETAEPSVESSGLADAYAAGKLDAGLIPGPSETAPGAASTPETITIAGQGGLYDALVEGKFDFAPGDPAVQYVLVPEVATGSEGLTEAYAAGKFDAGLVSEPSGTTASSEPVPAIVAIEGQGSLYDALIDGKYSVDGLAGTTGVEYVLTTESETGSSGLQSAAAAGRLVEGVDAEPSTESAQPTTGAPTVSGGHQQ
jgi:hypothetical protein